MARENSRKLGKLREDQGTKKTGELVCSLYDLLPARVGLGAWMDSAAALESARMRESLGAKTLIYPAPVLVVGTFDGAGRPNVMTASWGGICCSQPPCVAV